MTSDTVECSVCGARVGRMGIGQHAGKHKRDFTAAVGRPPESYDEVREWFDGDLADGEPTDLSRWSE